ncbi:DUF2853 family protein [Paracoccus suum]|uniref:DUF2853 family protein n=1 Tax=Paracoccus suum TaxID=2259340 RepID=A0A344PI92_9RHOB|nr:DUF2853 family protein [Paracoccus suum]AXC49097.1 DUF2853 family protein [Paracoccus suum]
MSRRDELVAKYAADLGKLGQEADMDLLMRCTKACGPSIYSADSETVAASDPEEVARLKKSFLVKRLGMTDGPELDAGIKAAVEAYGTGNRNKFRPVMYYLLARHFDAGARV